jgi:hypothetical protein
MTYTRRRNDDEEMLAMGFDAAPSIDRPRGARDPDDDPDDEPEEWEEEEEEKEPKDEDEDDEGRDDDYDELDF